MKSVVHRIKRRNSKFKVVLPLAYKVRDVIIIVVLTLHVYIPFSCLYAPHSKLLMKFPYAYHSVYRQINNISMVLSVLCYL